MSRRVVITGVGMVTPIGVGVEEVWQAMLAGRSGAGPITRFDVTEFPVKFACELKDFDPTRWIDKRVSKTLDRFVQYALAGAAIAYEDAQPNVSEAEAEMFGTFVGAGLGGVETIEKTYEKVLAKGPRRISPYFVPAIIVNLAAGHISIKYNCKGPNLSQVSACSTGAHAIGDAFRCIERGDADIMFAGGSEAAVSPLGVGGFTAAKALSKRGDDPTKASRPFDNDRDGFVVGEGAGIVIVETLERAQQRGAKIYAEIIGYGLTGDAYHITKPSPEGDGAQRCMRMALRTAGLRPDQVDYINAHGTSTKLNDSVETFAIKQVFGDHAYKMPVSSTKSMTGHMLGAAGGVEIAITAMMLTRSVILPTINYDTPDPDCDLDYVPNEPREQPIRVAMSNSFGFGGTNACLILRRFEG